MKPIYRTWLGIALFVPLAAILLATFACLPLPLGDPEKAKVDDKLVGTFQAVNTDAGETVVAILRPWDTHTYYVTWIDTDKKDNKEETKVMHFKAWLTDIGGATFLVAQPLEADEVAQYISGDKTVRVWPTFRIEKTKVGLDARMVDSSSEILKALVDGVKDGKTNPVDIEAAIKAHVDDKALYMDKPISFKKLSQEDQKSLEETLKRANLSTGM